MEAYVWNREGHEPILGPGPMSRAVLDRRLELYAVWFDEAAANAVLKMYKRVTAEAVEDIAPVEAPPPAEAGASQDEESE